MKLDIRHSTSVIRNASRRGRRHSSSVIRHLSFVIATVAAWLAATAARHAASAAFAYQGRLMNADGSAPLTGNQTVEMRLYTSADGGSPVWGHAYNVLLDDTGLFNIEVSDSSGSALADAPAGATLQAVFAANADTTIHIGLTVVGTSGEIAPRQALLAVPYATFAANVAHASGDLAVGGHLSASSATVSNAVSAGSMAISGALGAATLATSGAATIGGDLSVGGSITGFGVAPVGAIILWSGSVAEIPSDWALCNGQTKYGHQTPDLRNRFVVGAGGEYAVRDTGGEKTHTLTEGEMPLHNHSYKFNGADLNGSWDGDNYFYDASDHYSGNGNTKYTEYTGGNQPHENRPPYYALCYIMRVR